MKPIDNYSSTLIKYLHNLHINYDLATHWIHITLVCNECDQRLEHSKQIFDLRVLNKLTFRFNSKMSSINNIFSTNKSEIVHSMPSTFECFFFFGLSRISSVMIIWWKVFNSMPRFTIVTFHIIFLTKSVEVTDWFFIFNGTKMLASFNIFIWVCSCKLEIIWK